MTRDERERILLDALWNIREALIAASRAQAGDAPNGHVMNEAIYFLWETRITKKKIAECEKRRFSKAAKITNGKILYDHAVPRDVLNRSLFSAETTKKEFDNLIISGCHIGLITEEEHERLSKLGLKQKMPPNWKHGDSMFARYQMANIDF